MENKYQTPRVIQRDNKYVLRFAETDDQSIIDPESPSELLAEYTKFCALPLYHHHSMKNVLALGGGGYMIQRHLLRLNASITVDTVEINPLVTQLAYEYFCLAPDNRLRIIHHDAASFLQTCEAMYDYIVVDVYDGLQVPESCKTIRFYQDIARVLADGGIVMLNIISTLLPDSELMSAIEKLSKYFLYHEIFLTANTFVYKHIPDNCLLFVSNQPLALSSGYPNKWAKKNKLVMEE